MPQLLFSRRLTTLDLRDEEIELDGEESRKLAETFGFGEGRFPILWPDGSSAHARLRDNRIECPGLSEQIDLLWHETEFFAEGRALVVVPREDPEKEAFLRAAASHSLVEDEARIHHEMQAIICDIGGLLQYKIWVPLPDREAVLGLTEASETLLEKLPEFTFNPIVNRIARLIDVIFIPADPSQRPALFEVESTTTISSGLLRMHDVFLFRRDCEMSIVAHKSRRPKYDREIARPTFQSIKDIVRFQSYEDIRDWKGRVTKELG